MENEVEQNNETVVKIEKKKNKLVLKILIVLVALAIVIGVLTIAPNYIMEKDYNKINLVINNNNITSVMKKDVIIENNTIYIAKEDLANFFDEFIYYDEKNNQIITTYYTNIAIIELDNNNMILNKNEIPLKGKVLEKDNTFYLPFSEMSKVYNVEIKYHEDTKVVTADSLERKLVTAEVQKDASVKTAAKYFTRTADFIKKGETVVFIQEASDGYVKIRTDSGKLGYVKADVIGEKTIVREAIEEKEKIQGKVSLVWDYFSEVASAPDRSNTTIQGINVVSPTFIRLEKLGKGEIQVNIGVEGKNYIEWARKNGYQVWPMVSNEGMIDTTSEILNDYELRQKLINNIIEVVKAYELEGINIDFEYMYQKDKNVFSRFLIELEPRLKQLGAVLSVDVTAPDGSENWSLCYDRNTISKVADYIVFMAYDQYGSSDTKAGTTAGYNWVETNIKKFIGQEGVKPEKIVLGIPFYSRVWREDSTGKAISNTIDMSNIPSKIPAGVEKQWNEDLKQYYIEYQQNGYTYKMWIEDETSIKEKLNLVNKYNLAGAAFWEKDKETVGLWEIIEEQLTK